MATGAVPASDIKRYVVIHVATTCDEHGVYVQKDSAEVIELGWLLLDAATCDEVNCTVQGCESYTKIAYSCIETVSW